MSSSTTTTRSAATAAPLPPRSRWTGDLPKGRPQVARRCGLRQIPALSLGRLFRQRFFSVLGLAVAACGVVGLVLAAADAATWIIAAVRGVAPGALLLAAGWWGSRREPTATIAPASITVA